MIKRKLGFGALLEELEKEEELYIPKSYIVCPLCNSEIRTDQCPQKESEIKFCSCKNLKIGCIEGDGHPCRVGSRTGFTTINYKTEHPKFIDKDI